VVWAFSTVYLHVHSIVFVRRSLGDQSFSHLLLLAASWEQPTCSHTYVILTYRTHNKFGDRGFSAAGHRLWNDLPPGLQRPHGTVQFDSFRHSLKSYLFGDWSTLTPFTPKHECGSVAIRSAIMKVISFFTYAADKVSPCWLRTLSVLPIRRRPYSVHGVRTLGDLW